MTKKEWRLARSGRGVADWTPCVNFLQSVCKQIAPLHAEFLHDYPFLCGKCTVVSQPTPPAILLDFERVREHPNIPVILIQKDMSLILHLLFRFISSGIRGNLTLGVADTNPFHPVFPIVPRSYAPFMPQQRELAWFQKFAGEASLPRRIEPTRPPWMPPECSFIENKQRGFRLSSTATVAAKSRRGFVRTWLSPEEEAAEADDIPFEW
ncbi:MAG: hypothetical protein A2664_04350 [Candidatus Taylorbacteria bacterium RIFCSPHIGHO2_01_FULL_46_22b]|uniref:Uncharacterized protein n=1 Tax=Candidatus Taylorbacteria bacterium RIFCSPHIGHO2_01_FULL_46_22b TaxID=1802301 RepID=A0A1G2M211_9BACT|nr:MAG: hypothetical protein A2664_04350 [Candidatus Taylorbacteria bacterium RIFCSPHIGHO2_01_FULL_46_22b]